MLLWESFDNLEARRQENLKKQAERLKNRTIELEAVKEEAKKIAYAEALDKATEDFHLKKEHAVKELTTENAQQIKNIHDMIEKSVKEQSLHYAKLLTNILGHFIPKLSEHKAYDQVSETLSFILKGCDKRQLIIAAHHKTLERFTQLISLQTRRIELVEENDLKEGMIKVMYEGGGAEMDISEYQTKAIQTISEMLGFTVNAPEDNNINNIKADEKSDVQEEYIAHEDRQESKTALPEPSEKAEEIKESTPEGNQENEEKSVTPKPLFEDFGEGLEEEK